MQVLIGPESGREKFIGLLILMLLLFKNVSLNYLLNSGFMLMAVNPGDSSNKPLGQFINNPRPARSMDCPSGEQVQ